MVIIRSAVQAPNVKSLAASEALIFDLDNTLYPHGANLWIQVDRNIGAYVSDLLGLPADEARKVQKHYFHTYGTTLNGLMAEHQIDAADYLDKVHQIDVSELDPDHRLDEALGKLPGRKLIFTNGSRGHAERILAQIGIADHFEEIFDIVSADYVPKPNDAPYDAFVKAYDIDPQRSVYFEDMARNLFPAKDRGMATVLVETDHEWARQGEEDPRIDYVTGDLAGFVEGMVAALC